jgi:effector-binding domain-containing protein
MVEKVSYDVLKKLGDIEIRKYPEIILAVVKEHDDDAGFGLLFNYISGENTTQKKIKMTAPVISSEKIQMTAPVISQKNYMAFIVPSSYNKENVPKPTNPKVGIEIQPVKTVAVIRFSGYSSYNNVEKHKQKLLTQIKTNKLKTKGEPYLMRYNSPFAPGFIRRNEVAIEVFLK